MNLKKMISTWGFLLLGISSALALECDSCRKNFDLLRDQLLMRDKTVALLDQNKRYLAQLSSEDASKFLKVNSNVIMILKRLDAIKTETEKVNDTIAKNGCTDCKVSSDPTFHSPEKSPEPIKNKKAAAGESNYAKN